MFERGRDLCERCGRVDCTEWRCAVDDEPRDAAAADEASRGAWQDAWEQTIACAIYGLFQGNSCVSEIRPSAVQSTIDDAVKAIMTNKEHSWATQPATESEGSFDYCTRCGRKKADLGLPIENTYIDCKGFVG